MKEIEQLQAELVELKKFEKLAMTTSVCPDCGTGIVGYCLGCKVKQLQADLAAMTARAEAAEGENKKALETIEHYGGIGGDHHRCWVIDQVVRAITGDDYEDWVAEMKDGEEGPNTYGWDEGIAP